MSEPLLAVERLHHRYLGIPTTEAPALDGVSFTVAEGELVTIVGPSGSGKTTLLRCIAGLMQPSGGEIRLAGRPVTEVPAELAIVFQEYGRSLFPWMTVRENVDMPVRHQRLSPAEREERITSSLAEVGLSDALDRFPWQLSGGMQQRVAIARALAYRPALLLMDEPFGSVDAQTRADLQDMLLGIWAAHGSTVLFITHDIDESVYLSDRIVVLSASPGTVAAEIPVPLPRPRDQVETRASAAFVSLRAAVARLILRPPSVPGGSPP